MRKFSCRNPYCERKVFAERLPAFVEPWARATIRFYQQVTSIGLATCGKGGTRLAARLGIQTTRQTILRRIMALPDSSPGVILFLGIDDFSFRRGCRFGTILVNLESRRVVDLLPDREAETSAVWMHQQTDLHFVNWHTQVGKLSFWLDRHAVFITHLRCPFSTDTPDLEPSNFIGSPRCCHPNQTGRSIIGQRIDRNARSL